MKISVSVLGLLAIEPTLFDNLKLPDGVDREVLIAEIMAECSDFCLLYPDGDFMKYMIGMWSRAESKVWAAMQRSVELEYNPIENYDRQEDIRRTVESAGKESTDYFGESGTGENSRSTTSRTSFNSNEPRETNRVDGAGESNSRSESLSLVDTEGSATESIISRIHGNIGVTTAQQMIAGYREISDFTVTRFIVDSFKRRFCIQVY